jgi:hypothetical protein
VLASCLFGEVRETVRASSDLLEKELARSGNRIIQRLGDELVVAMYPVRGVEAGPGPLDETLGPTGPTHVRPAKMLHEIREPRRRKSRHTRRKRGQLHVVLAAHLDTCSRRSVRPRIALRALAFF